MTTAPGICAENISKLYPSASGNGQATGLRRIDLAIGPGDMVGVVGQTGAGKTTLLRILAGMCPPDTGTVTIDGETAYPEHPRDWRRLRRMVRYVPQDPASILHPRVRIQDLLLETIRARHTPNGRNGTGELATVVKDFLLSPHWLQRYPGELSLGQQRRLALVLGLLTGPRYLLLDEPLSGLDGAAKKRYVWMLRSLRDVRNTAMIIVSHDIESVREVTDLLILMRDGYVLELSYRSREGIWPVLHPYWDAMLGNNQPHALTPPQIPVHGTIGCCYRGSCPLYAENISLLCELSQPTLRPIASDPNNGGRVACHLVEGRPISV